MGNRSSRGLFPELPHQEVAWRSGFAEEEFDLRTGETNRVGGGDCGESAPRQPWYPPGSQPKKQHLRNLHAWKTRTPDRGRREVRAQLHGKRWSFSERYQDEEDWTILDPPGLEDLESLHEVLYNKYQRKHLSWDHVRGVEQLIQERRSRG